MELLSQLRLQVNKKLENLDVESSKKFLLIQALLKEDDCFFQMKMDTAYSILKDLGVSDEMIPTFYSELTSPKSYEQLPQFYIYD